MQMFYERLKARSEAQRGEKMMRRCSKKLEGLTAHFFSFSSFEKLRMSLKKMVSRPLVSS